MPRSMTGYGAASVAGSRIHVECEIRTVNSRSLKISLRTPSVLNARESEIESWIRKRVRRGSLTCFVRLSFLKADDLLRIKPEIVRGFANAIAALAKEGLVEPKLTAAALAALPGVVESGASEPLRPADLKVVRNTVTAALDALEEMRGREATHLIKDLRVILKRMRKTLAGIRKRAPHVVTEYRDRLRERVAQLLDGSGAHLDDATLAREVAVYADRCDITEELTRLAAHFDEFDRYLALDEEIGRTLDFLCQELLRETNTIGSKSGDVEIARRVIELKSDIDRLKEQVANLE